MVGELGKWFVQKSKGKYCTSCQLLFPISELQIVGSLILNRQSCSITSFKRWSAAIYQSNTSTMTSCKFLCCLFSCHLKPRQVIKCSCNQSFFTSSFTSILATVSSFTSFTLAEVHYIAWEVFELANSCKTIVYYSFLPKYLLPKSCRV